MHVAAEMEFLSHTGSETSVGAAGSGEKGFTAVPCPEEDSCLPFCPVPSGGDGVCP